MPFPESNIASRGWLQEFQSLSTAPLSGTHKGKLFWDTPNAGISWQPLMLEMQPPADSANRRLPQMRLIARQFTAAEQTNTDSPSSLRLLTTPLYRYSQIDEGVIDGALFSFAIGTDPSVLLLVEARQADQDPKGDAKKTDVVEWKIAFAPTVKATIRPNSQGLRIRPGDLCDRSTKLRRLHRPARVRSIASPQASQIFGLDRTL